MELSFSTPILSVDRCGGQPSEALFGALYRELRGIARRELARSGSGGSLGATSLLHEAYLDIAQRDRREGRQEMTFPDRARFFTYAARVMRGLIIDGLRRRQARKRGGGCEMTTVEGKDFAAAAPSGDAEEIERLGQALDELAAVEPQLAGERDRVRREARKAAQVSGFLTDLLTHADPYAAGMAEPTVRSLLDAGAARVRRDLAAQPELRRDMLALLGRIYLRRGADERALPLLEEAVALGRRTLGPSRELARSLTDLGVALGQRARLDAARARLAEALAIERKVLGDAHPDVAVTHSELGRVCLDQGRPAAARALLLHALAVQQRSYAAGDRRLVVTQDLLGRVVFSPRVAISRASKR
jgi:DNA-directed RNA polymerase specialized sigma24 family protein